eukprot:1583192-Amphidinium_carterae.1
MATCGMRDWHSHHKGEKESKYALFCHVLKAAERHELNGSCRVVMRWGMLSLVCPQSCGHWRQNVSLKVNKLVRGGAPSKGSE